MSGSEDLRASAGSPQYRRALVALFFAGVATFAQIYSPQGLLPDISRDFGVSASASSLAIGATTVGVSLALLPWGRLSDRIGRVRALRIAICAAVLVALCEPFIPTFEAFVALRFVEGVLLAGLPAIGVVALSETVTPLALGGAVGGFVAGNTMGGLLGRIVATRVGESIGWQWGVFSVTLISVVSALLFVLLMPPTVVKPGPRLPLGRATLENLRTPGVMAMVAQGTLLMGGFVAAYNYLAFRLQGPPFELSLTQVSWLFLGYFAGAASSRLVWVFARRIPPVAMLLLSIVVMLFGLVITMLPSLPLVITGLVVFTVGFFGAHSIALALVSKRASGDGKSLAPSLYYLGYYLGSTLFGWAGGLAFILGGWTGTALMIALLAILAAGIAWLNARRHGGLYGVDADPRAR